MKPTANHRTGGALPMDFSEPSWGARMRLFVREHDSFTYANFLDRLVGLYGPRTAFVLDRPIDYPGFSGSVLSYADVGRLVDRIAAALLAAGVGRGDRVGLITMNRIEIAFCGFALGKIGAVPVPMNFLLRAGEVDHIVRRSGAEIVIADPAVLSSLGGPESVPSVKRWLVVGDEPTPAGTEALADLMRDARGPAVTQAPASKRDVAIVFFTSGTTGMPKGAAITHESAVVYLRHHGRFYALRPRLGPNLALLVMPVAHAGGYAALMSQLAIGTPAYFMSRFDPAAILDAIERVRPTLFSGTPAMYRMLLDAGALHRDLTSIRVWAGGADAFPDTLIRTFRDAAARPSAIGVRRKPMFIRGYGMAEANTYVAQTPPFAVGDHCIGWVLPPVRHRVVDRDGRDVPRGRPGELWLTGPTITPGYWEDEEATAAAIEGGWYRTGDIVRRGKWGMLYFVGRSNDIIKSGGYKISAVEIDSVIAEHPEVEHVATVGVPDPVRGERPVAAITLARGSSATAEDVLAWARDRIARHKRPWRVVILPSLPLTFSLKPKRFEVRERVLALLGDDRSV